MWWTKVSDLRLLLPVIISFMYIKPRLTQKAHSVLFLCALCSVILTFTCFLACPLQSNKWWKLKTIVHWPFSATQRRKLNWVQLAGHKGMTCLDHRT